MFKHWNKSLSIGVIFGLLGIGYLAGSFFIKKTRLEGVVGAEFVPRVYVAILFICVAVQLYQGIRQYIADCAKDEESKPVNWTGLRNVLIAFVCIFVYVSMLETLGFLLCSTVLLYVLCMLMTPGYKKPNHVGYGVLAVVLPLVAFFLFKYLMYMPLPIGTVFGG